MITETNRGGVCGICLREFASTEKQYTHVGGEHDGFHKHCLTPWIIQNPTCPYDRQQIDPSLLVSRTERIMARLRPALVNAAYAASCGVIVGVAAGAAMVVIETAVEGIVAAGAAAAAAAGPAAGLAATVGGAVGVAAGTAAVALEIADAGIDRILEDRRVDPIARDIIHIGISAGSMALLAAVITGIVSTPLTAMSLTLTAIPIISVIGGSTAGILSLVR
jgi:hypothetical protein